MRPSIADVLIQPWWVRWMAQRWGHGDHACHLWAATGLVFPALWRDLFGGKAEAPIEVVIIYRELTATGRAETDIALDIVKATPQAERKQIVGFTLGNDALGGNTAKRGANTVEEMFGRVLERHGLPRPTLADEHRVDGWRFVFNCLRQAELCKYPTIDAERAAQGPVLLISAACPAVIENLPLAVRDAKSMNDVEERPGELWTAVADAVRYLMRAKPAPKTEVPRDVRLQLLCQSITDPTARHLALLRFQHDEARKSRLSRAPNWRTGS